MSVALDESDMNKLSLSMTERIYGRKKNYRVGFYMKSLQSDKNGMAERRQRFSPCRELQLGDIRSVQSMPQNGRKGSDCDGERGYCSDPEYENSSHPKSGAVYALLEGVQPIIHLRLQYRGSLERPEFILKSERNNPTITVSPAVNTTTQSTTSGRKRLSESDPIELEEDGESGSSIPERTCEDKMKFESRQLPKVEEQSEKDSKEIAASKLKEVGNNISRSSTFSTGRKPFRKSLKRRKRAEASRNMLTLKPTLEDIIKNKATSLAFRAFLRSEFSEENLDFWLECENYKSLKGSKQSKAAHRIFNEYIEVNAPKEVNLDSKLRDRTRTCIVKPDKSTFLDSQRSIFNLMNSDSFRRFLTSDAYKNIPEGRSKSPSKNKLFS